MALFDTDFLKKLEYLSLVSRRVFRGQILAQRRSLQFGGGVEFADHREYVAGEDLRYLDWNVYARHGELLLKRFQEEEDLPVYLMIDCSRSMGIGPDSVKFDFARKVAAALAYIALADLDRVAMVGFADEIIADFPLTRGKARILTLLQFLEDLPLQGTTTSLARMAADFVGRNQRRGLVIVVSDFFDPSGFERGIDLLRHRRYDTHLIQIYEPQEAEPNWLGDVDLLEVESQARMPVTVTEKNLRQYRQVFQQFLLSVQRYCRNYGLGCTQTSTEISFEDVILKMMRASQAVT